MTRPDVQQLGGRNFDLIVIGGGIHGCGIARDAAQRGMRVVLVEKGDLAAGTSSASSKLVHGGLRYLEYLRFGLVRESLRERETLLRIAPHLVRSLPFLVPLYSGRGRGRLKVAAGLTLYDLLSTGSSLPRHRMLSAAETLQREPDLRPSTLNGCAMFHDAQMNDARLVIENALDARRYGAFVLTQTECIDLVQDNHRVQGVVVRDAISGVTGTLSASLVVNAAGPWYTQVLGLQDLTRGRTTRLSRGTHIVVPPLTRGHALLLQARDRRVFFVLPWKGHSLVGTTDVEVDIDPDDARPTDDDIDYLLREVSGTFPSIRLDRSDVLASFAGLRALLPGEGEIGQISREAEVREEAPGLLCVLGGKYTTYRAVAERVVDLATTLADLKHIKPCRTHDLPLPGGDVPDMNDYFRVAEGLLIRETGLPVETLRYLLGTYGSRHGEVLEILAEDPAHAEPLEEGLPFLRAEVIHAVRNEFASELDDVLWRRTYRGFLGPLDDSARARWEECLEVALRSQRLLS